MVSGYSMDLLIQIGQEMQVNGRALPVIVLVWAQV